MVLKKKHLKIFIYMIVAYFVGLAVILYDFSVSYAASDELYWMSYQCGTGDSGNVSNPDYVAGDPSTSGYVPSLSSDLGYNYKIEAYCQRVDDKDVSYSNYILTSKKEVVVVYSDSFAKDYASFFGYSSPVVDNALLFLSLDSTTQSYVHLTYSNGVYTKGQWDSMYDNRVIDGRSVYPGGDTSSVIYAYYGMLYTHNSSEGDFIYSIKTDMKVFSDIGSAYNYLVSGKLSNLLYDGSVPQRKYDGDNIYLNDFQMIVHDSNAYSAYYIEFKYTIPEQLRDAASLKLDIAESFEWCIGLVANIARIPKTFSGTNYIDILQNPTGFKLYLKDIDAVTDLVGNTTLSNLTRRAVLGSNMGPIDLSALTIDGIGGETLGIVTNSKLYLTCYVVANNTYGQSVSGSVDFLSGANGIGTYTPNASGEYKYNGDYKENGHYETKVAVDDSGNQEYTYYYYSTDNSKKEITAKDSHDNTFTSISPPSGGSSGSIINNITMPDHIFVNLSGGGSGGGSDIPDVTIEDDDLTFDSLRDSIKDGYGLIDDTDTAAKGDGLVAMMSDLFGYLPASFTRLIMLGISSVVGIAILRMIVKR